MAHPSPTSPRRQAAIPALLAAFALLLGACSNADRPTLADRAAPTSVTSTTAPSGPTTTQVRLDELPPGPENLLGYIATPLGTEPEVRTAPDPQAERLEIGATTEVGAPTTFAVLGDPGVTSAATLVVEEKYLNFDKGGAYATAFLLTLVATLYPSWRASRINPAEALRYE